MSTFSQRSNEARFRAEPDAVPKLPITYVNVRPLNGAIVYTFEGVPIPQGEWSTVPVSAGIINAIRYGDLEEGEEGEAAHRHHHHRRRRRSEEERSG